MAENPHSIRAAHRCHSCWFCGDIFPQHFGARLQLKRRYFQLHFHHDSVGDQHYDCSELVHCQSGFSASAGFLSFDLYLLLGLHLRIDSQERYHYWYCHRYSSYQVHSEALRHFPLSIQTLQNPRRTIKIHDYEPFLRLHFHHRSHHPNCNSIFMQIQANLLSISFKKIITYLVSNDTLKANANSMSEYSDFISDWYVSIGYQILFNAIILVFHPALSMPIFYCFNEKIARCRAQG